MFRKPYGKPVRKLPSASPGTIDFRSLKHDQRLLPLDDARRSTVRGLARCLDDLPAVLDPSGYKPLREIVMKRLWLNGISADDGEILINAGHLQSLMLAIMLLTKPGDTVAMVAPTFWAIVPLLRHFQISIAGIPFTEDGPDLERTESLLSKSRPSFLYVMPNVHYPTCVTSGQDNRERLLRLCERFRVPLVEDGFEEDIKNTGKVLLPIKSMDKGKIVVYMGTFSRDLLGGMNAGWIAADRECVSRLAALKEVYDPGMPSLLQASIYQFFLRGRYEIHLRRLQKVYRRRLSVALRSLREHVSTSHATWHEPSGGYVVWLKLDGRLGPVDRVVERLASHRVLVYRGPPEYHSEPNRYVRLSFSALDEDAIDEGIRRLGKGLEAIDGGRRLVTGKSH